MGKLRIDAWSVWKEPVGISEQLLKTGQFGQIKRSKDYDPVLLEMQQDATQILNTQMRDLYGSASAALDAFHLTGNLTTRFWFRNNERDEDGVMRLVPICTWSKGGYHFLTEAHAREFVRLVNEGKVQEALDHPGIEPLGGWDPETKSGQALASFEDRVNEVSDKAIRIVHSRPMQMVMAVTGVFVTLGAGLNLGWRLVKFIRHKTKKSTAKRKVTG